MPGPEHRGIYLVVNDVYSEWLLALAASLHAHNSSFPVLVIPYDDRCARIRQISAAFGFRLWEPKDPLAMCDAIAAAVRPASARGAGMFRRFAAFAGPYPEFVYLDVDTLVLEPLGPLFDACAGSGRPILFGDGAGGYAYNAGARRDELRRAGALEWNTGVFYARTGAVSLAAMLDACHEDLPADRALLRDDAADQSFLNWFLATRQIASARFGGIADYGRLWASRRWTELAGHLYDLDPYGRPFARPVPIVHWAGEPMPSAGMPQAHLWQAYRAAADRVDVPVARAA
jgi:hypothetical protein